MNPGPQIPLGDIAEHIRAALDAGTAPKSPGESPRVIAVSAGAGKTTAAQDKLADDAQAGRAGAIAVPTLMQAEEIERQLRKRGVEVVRARSFSHACERFDLEDWGGRYRNLPGHACFKGCVERHRCAAWSWREKYRSDRAHTVLVLTHAMLRNLLGDSLFKPAYVIVDEAPAFTQSRHTWEAGDFGPIANPINGVGSSWVRDRHEFACILVGALAEAAGIRADHTARMQHPRFGYFIGGDELIALLERVAADLGTDLKSALSYKRIRSVPPFPRKLDLQLPPDRDEYPRVDIDLLAVDLLTRIKCVGLYVPGAEEERAPYFYRYAIDVPNFRKTPVVFLDATADLTKPIFEKHLGGPVVLHRASAPDPHTRHIHLRTTSYQARRVAHDSGRVQAALIHDLSRVFKAVKVNAATRLGVVTTKRLEPFVERVLRARSPFLRTPILHYGAMRGSNELERVDVLLLIGEPTPHVATSDFEAKVLGLDPREYLDACKRAELVQASARGRGIRRGSSDPLTVAWLVSAVPPVDVVHQTLKTVRGRPRSKARDDFAEVARIFLWNEGWIAAQLWNPSSPLRQVLKRFPPNWHLKNILKSDHLSGIPGSTGRKAFLERIRRTLRAIARADGLVEIHTRNPEGTGSILVFEDPDRPAAYEDFIARGRSNVVDLDAFRTPDTSTYELEADEGWTLVEDDDV